MSEENGYEVVASDDIITKIAYSCGGDVRKAMNTAELAVVCGEPSDGKVTITEDSLEVLAQRSNMRYDRDGDQHYDILSAFHKSVRGSDENAGAPLCGSPDRGRRYYLSVQAYALHSLRGRRSRLSYGCSDSKSLCGFRITAGTSRS